MLKPLERIHRPLNMAHVLCSDSVICHAMRVLTGDWIAFETSPQESKTLQLMYEVADAEFKHDFDLLCSCPGNLAYLSDERRLEWASLVLESARSDRLRSYTTATLLQIYADQQEPLAVSDLELAREYPYAIPWFSFPWSEGE